MEKDRLLVTLCVIAFNEEEYIEYLLDDILKQTYPHDKLEIILIDSMSTDSTKEHLKKFRDEMKDSFYNVIVCDNPKKRLACGWNTALNAYSGDIIIRVDAHSRLSLNFVEAGVKALMNGENIVGGKRPSILLKSTPWRQTLLMAEQSAFGGSVAEYRDSDKKAYVKSVFHGAYRRAVFDKVGKFDERLGRTEDNEMNYRIQKAGFKILYTPEIVSYEYLRDNLRQLLAQKFRNGYWIMATAKVYPNAFSWFHFVPFLFVLGILITTIMTSIGLAIFSHIMWILYFSISIIMSIEAVLEKRKSLYQLALPALFLLIHISYGMGSMVGLFSKKINIKG